MRLSSLLWGLALTGWACGGGSPPPAPARPAPTAPATPRTRAAAFVAAQVNGTVLHYRVEGTEGIPIVLVHGMLGGPDDWDAVVPAFAVTYRVLLYARRYHRPNPLRDDGGTYSPGLHARDLAALLDTLRFGPAHVIGASYGAYVALALALERPDLVRSLVLGEPPVLPLLRRTPRGDSLYRAFAATVLDPARAAFRGGDSVAALRRLTDAFAGEPGRFDALAPAVRAGLLAQAHAVRHGLLGDPATFSPPLACAPLGRIAAPVLLLRGTRSLPLFHAIVDELARCLNSETVLAVPYAGHRMEAANPGFYNVAVREFFALR